MSSSIDKVNQLLSGEWIIASKLDQNKVLDLNGGNVVLNDRNDSDTQKWTISYDTGSSIGRSFIIRNKSLGTSKSLTDDNSYAKLIDNATSYWNAIYQRWYLYYQDDGTFIIANYVGDYLRPSVLQVSGSNIVLSTHTGNDNQRFYFVAAN
ncbi:RICIN domain-containing protein [Sarcina ventriculi]